VNRILFRITIIQTFVCITCLYVLDCTHCIVTCGVLCDIPCLICFYEWKTSTPITSCTYILDIIVWYVKGWYYARVKQDNVRAYACRVTFLSLGNMLGRLGLALLGKIRWRSWLGFQWYLCIICSCRRAILIRSCRRAIRVRSCRRAIRVRSCRRAIRVRSCRRAIRIRSCRRAIRVRLCRRAIRVRLCRRAIRIRSCSSDRRMLWFV
jgi:hypothetical protein